MIVPHKLYFAIFTDSTFIISFTGKREPYDESRWAWETEEFVSLIWDIDNCVTTLNPNGKNEKIVERSQVMKKLKGIDEADLIDMKELVKALLSSKRY